MNDMGEAGMGAYEEASSLAIIVPLTQPQSASPSGPLRMEEFPRPGGNGRRQARPETVPLRRILEAILFAADRPVTIEQLACALPEVETGRIEDELQALAEAYRESGSGVQLLITGGGLQLRSDPDLHEYVTRFLEGKRRGRLSRAAMETLAIIAYRQPITRGEAEDVRGVDCGQVLHTLLERDLITVRGRSQALGRPLLYGTTEQFLHYFGIRSLADLPTPEELTALLGGDPLEDPEIRESLEAQGLMEPAGDAEPADGATAAEAESAAETDAALSGESGLESEAESALEPEFETDADSELEPEPDSELCFPDAAGAFPALG
jgi:segregation and condensation protein B